MFINNEKLNKKYKRKETQVNMVERKRISSI